MALHKWNDKNECVKCGLLKIVEKQEKFILTRYVDRDTGEAWLRAPDCSERLVVRLHELVNQLKLF